MDYPVAEERLKRDCELGWLRISLSPMLRACLQVDSKDAESVTSHLNTAPAVAVCVFYVLLCPIETTTNVIETFFLRRIFQARKIYIF